MGHQLFLSTIKVIIIYPKSILIQYIFSRKHKHTFTTQVDMSLCEIWMEKKKFEYCFFHAPRPT